MNLNLKRILVWRIVWEGSTGPLLFERQLEVPQEWQIFELMQKDKTVKINWKNEIQSLWATDVNDFMFVSVKNFLIQKLVLCPIILWYKQRRFFGKDEVCPNDINTVSLNRLFELENFLQINPDYSLVQSQPTLIIERNQSGVLTIGRKHFVFLVVRIVLSDVWFFKFDWRWCPHENALFACLKTDFADVWCLWIMLHIFNRNKSVESQEFVP